MSTTAATNPYPNYFRRRRLGRAASPPTWACYEQIRYDDERDFSDSDSASEVSCSEDDEDYTQSAVDSQDGHAAEVLANGGAVRQRSGIDTDDIDMDMGEENDDDRESARGRTIHRSSSDSDFDESQHRQQQQAARDVKGKQKAVVPVSESDDSTAQQPPQTTRTNTASRRAHGRQVKKKNRSQPVCSLRPILTIQKSQGFVWNQDLFVPPYIKDRYIASMSPPNSRGFISTSASSTNSALTDYEVEVVEIRIKEGELGDIIGY